MRKMKWITHLGSRYHTIFFWVICIYGYRQHERSLSDIIRLLQYGCIKEETVVDSGKLYATTSKKAIEESSDVFINMMIPMMGMIVGLSVIIFAIVMKHLPD